MNIFRDKETATLPVYATQGSACFDLHACIEEGTKYLSYNPFNRPVEHPVKLTGNGPVIQIHSDSRVLVPTGLIFDIPELHLMKIFIRSSMALKMGLTLANSVAIIDSDYVDPLFVMLYNMSDTIVTIHHGDRIAQGALEKMTVSALTETAERPTQKTDRVGGLGSTGVNELV